MKNMNLKPKRLIWVPMCVFLASAVWAQTPSSGVNTLNPDPSAVLHISATDKGLLIPRVTLSGLNDVTTVATPANGLLVFNTAAAGTAPLDVEVGFYYYSSAAALWVPLSADNNFWIDKTSRITAATALTAQNSTDKVQIESGGSVSLDGSVLPDGFSSLLINNSTAATTVTFSNFSGAYELNTSRSDITADGSFQLEYLESAIITVSENFGSKYLNISKCGDGVVSKIALWDRDKDTRVQVEESTDEDIIRFDTAGDEHFTMNGPRLSVLNSGRSVFIGEGVGTNDDLSDNQNVFIGKDVGNLNVSGDANTALGSQVLAQNTTGRANAVAGYQALGSNTIGYNNTALGAQSLYGNTSGNDNTALGFLAGRYTNAGDENQASSGSLYLGHDTRSAASGSSNEIVIGANARGLGSNSAVYGNDAITKHIFPAGQVGFSSPYPILGKILDVGQNMKVRDVMVGGHNNAAGNFHIDSTNRPSGTSIYLNWSGGGGFTYVGNGAGNYGTMAAGSYNFASDRRLKENIQSTRYGLESVLKMEVKDYNYISDKEQTLSTGFIAQDLVKIFPAAVTVGADEVDGDGKLKRPWAIDYSKLTPVLIKALQERQALIEKLTKRVEQLEKNK